MIKFFAYDSAENKIIINEPEILLVKEFADLWTNERNKCKEDPTGKKKLRGFRELIYIYMAIDWGAPGNKDTPANRHKYALEASGLTEAQIKDSLFLAAKNKYRELLEKSSVAGLLVEAYTNKIHEMRIFLESIDYNERDAQGKPIFKMADTIKEMLSISKAMDSLQELEARYRADLNGGSNLRGDKKPGMFD